MRRFLVAGLIVIVLAVAAWTGAWFYFAGQVEGAVDEWAAARGAEGVKIAHGPVSVSGFPFAWAVTIAQPDAVATHPPFWSWHGAAVAAEIRPWMRGEVPLAFPGEHVLTLGAGPGTRSIAARAEQPAGWAWVDGSGRLAEIGLDLRGLDVSVTPENQRAHVAQARLGIRPQSARGDAIPAVADVSLDLMDLTLPQAPANGFGRDVARVIVDATLKGKVERLPLPLAIAVWRDGGGIVDVRRATMMWGPLAIEADGTLALDAQNRPLGAGTARVRGYGETIDALVGSGAVGARDGATVKIALNLLARPAGNGQGRELEVPLTVQDGRLYAAGFALMRVQPLKLE